MAKAATKAVAAAKSTKVGKLNIADLKTNYDAKTGGVWIPVCMETGFVVNTNARFKIASSGTGAFKRAQALALKNARNAGQELTDEQINDVTAELLVEHIIRDWEGDDICDGDDVLPYSRDNAVRLMREVEIIRDWVGQQADNIGNFTEQRIRELEGN